MLLPRATVPWGWEDSVAAPLVGREEEGERGVAPCQWLSCVGGNHMKQSSLLPCRGSHGPHGTAR